MLTVKNNKNVILTHIFLKFLTLLPLLPLNFENLSFGSFIKEHEPGKHLQIDGGELETLDPLFSLQVNWGFFCRKKPERLWNTCQKFLRKDVHLRNVYCKNPCISIFYFWSSLVMRIVCLKCFVTLFCDDWISCDESSLADLSRFPLRKMIFFSNDHWCLNFCIRHNHQTILSFVFFFSTLFRFVFFDFSIYFCQW